jgi:hypothetical protein
MARCGWPPEVEVPPSDARQADGLLPFYRLLQEAYQQA